jgi:hypothetical protein
MKVRSDAVITAVSGPQGARPLPDYCLMVANGVVGRVSRERHDAHTQEGRVKDGRRRMWFACPFAVWDPPEVWNPETEAAERGIVTAYAYQGQEQKRAGRG